MIEVVEKVAKLARLELKEEEKELFAKQFRDILSFVEKLKEVDTEGVEPFTYGGAPYLREDQEGETLSPELALMNAPQRENGFFVVPRVVEV